MSRQRTIIEAGGNPAGYWKDLWNYRGLFRFLAWRDLLVRYKQTVIGIAWAVIRPLLTIGVFTFFGAMFDTATGTVPRVLLVTAATLPWTLFSSALGEASNSLIANSNLITKVYFPRLIVPLSTIIVCFVDFLIAFVILIALMIYYGQWPGPEIFALPAFLLLAILSATGGGLLLSALNVKYRDFRYIVPFIVQLGLFVSPIAFSSSEIYASQKLPEFIKWIYSLNPMVAVIDGFRWSLFGEAFPVYWNSVYISIGVTALLLIGGVWYFRKVERSFADVI
ncbi:MAG: ABC transporter permease [Bacteroidia bacterium]|jgi:lipopolysaccharide transport system permease protein|nr:ABC transporter permease [Bacteroidia bacterium]